jgi:hypothetical protein
MLPNRLPSSRIAATLALMPVIAACSSESRPSGLENVEVQVSSYFLYQGGTIGSVFPSALLTGPSNSATFSFTNTNDISGSKDLWHKYKFALGDDDQVTLQVNFGGNVILERTCTVHPRAVALTYAELIAYPAGGEALFETETPLPPGPSVHCACGFREYGDDRNANQCAP